MKRFWNVQIEVYEYGAVKAAVAREREASAMPCDRYKRDAGREVYSLWFGSEAEARGTVLEVLAMGGKREAAA